ncbi:MAG TPA: YkgJ family cysteine cluster protein [Azospirillaceae bacterium]|nr:YkgJ family cysteine cluster protein [Azospirillaceae bacterium]
MTKPATPIIKDAQIAILADITAGITDDAIGRRLMAEADRVVEMMRRKNPPACPLACKSRCTSCCHRGVEVTVPEARTIFVHIATRFTPSEQAHFAARVVDVAERTKGMSATERPRAAVPCAFLGDNGRCQIYQVRPMMCRAVAATDAGGCRSAFMEGVTGAERTWDPPIQHIKQVLSGTASGYQLATGVRGAWELHTLLAAAYTKTAGATAREPAVA